MEHGSRTCNELRVYGLIDGSARQAPTPALKRIPGLEFVFNFLALCFVVSFLFCPVLSEANTLLSSFLSR